ncbi:hypothetical protein CEP88_00570 [Roseobacter denitrificans]|uniref:Uncharacterized protein n=1 Tax=Roseobacter denitrificans (strain ATCC 33942 / OCh 114) TaxID=375451 RepID=Q168A6_ROSDO|nr:hypothetical protein [Roseobacter denitrificans]ABG31687.1 hypothetical protein RD1_2085 [Roseobacter denitrificans OCh 114]AVL51282.1 hypothetical protein CEP88_00570 [Roseobacter denitrificans]SFF88330.1 hypothetical protein SAMN05443635_103145 [Roseobacter denitrificans OCh 114]
MSDAFTQFEKRRDRLERRHRAPAKGYVAQVDPDGLITISARPTRSGLNFRFIGAAAFGFLAFKALAIALIGPVTYQGRIDALAAGHGFEKLCAWIMQADPISLQIATFLLMTVG